LIDDFNIELHNQPLSGKIESISKWKGATSNQIETVNGKLFDSHLRQAGVFVISHSPDNTVSGLFNLTDGRNFELTGDKKQTFLYSLKTRDIPTCGNTHLQHHNPHQHNPVKISKQRSNPTSQTTIDVMVVYSPEARAAAGSISAMESEISSAMALANSAYSDSRININLRLVRTRQLETSESDNFATNLERLTNSSDNHWDYIHSERDASGADLVVFLVNNSSSCGLAWVLSDANLSDASNGFSVVSRQCISYYSFAHEIGHNLGAVHDYNNSSFGGIYHDSYGWRFTGSSGQEWRTIMAYQPGIRINHFSNPDVRYDQVATGRENEANNSRTFNITKDVINSYRTSNQSVPTPVPTSGATNTATPSPTNNGNNVPPPLVTQTPYQANTPSTTPATEYVIMYKVRKSPRKTHLITWVKNQEGAYMVNMPITLLHLNGTPETKIISSSGRTGFNVRKGKTYRLQIDNSSTDWFKIPTNQRRQIR
jgi:hypothetical protein